MGSRNNKCVSTKVWFGPPYLVLEWTGSMGEQNLVVVWVVERRRRRGEQIIILIVSQMLISYSIWRLRWNKHLS